MMNRLYIFVLSAALLVVSGCQQNPVTGRETLHLVSSSEMQSMSYTEYKQFLSSNKISNNAEQTAMVRKVGTNIQKAVEQYYASKGLSSRLSGYNWEFNLVEDPSINAWCMPGGKVVVYTGIMPLVQNETGLAVVLGHEISHAIAEHGNERMSQGLIQQMGGVALSVALANKPQATQALFNQAYNAGSQVGIILPFSRADESEADHMGLIFMAMAGYDPQQAIAFWERMKAASAGSQKPSEFMSTHPSDETRIADIKKEMPEALQYYKK